LPASFPVQIMHHIIVFHINVECGLVVVGDAGADETWSSDSWWITLLVVVLSVMFVLAVVIGVVAYYFRRRRRR